MNINKMSEQQSKVITKEFVQGLSYKTLARIQRLLNNEFKRRKI